MAITVALAVTPSTPAHGQIVTATYAVSGNTGTPAGPAQAASVDGDVTLGGVVQHVSTSVTLPGTPAVPPLTEAYSVPVCAGLTFTATGDPHVFTAVVP